VGAKNLKHFPITFLSISGKSKHFLFFPTTKTQFFFYRKSNFFCDLKPHAKFQNPTITPFGTKVTGAERRRRRKTLLIVDT
jgi:hypothetical protein